MEILVFCILAVLFPLADAACGAPSGVSNGWRSYPNTNENTYAYYYCNTGYYSSGTNYIYCYSSWAGFYYNYYWTSLGFSCHIRDCGTPPSVSNAGRSYSATTYNSRVTYSCNTGYTAYGTNYILCSSSGTWPTPSYSCTIKNCGSPVGVTNGGRTFPATTYNSRATYYCNTGYYGSGTNYITCQSNGYWSNLYYSCIIRNCGNPPTVTNGARSYTTTTYGSRVTYSCNAGYYGSGTNYLDCPSSGTWPSLSYSCPPKNCGTPPTVANSGSSFTTTTYTSSVTYTCNTGYTASGTNRITCPTSGVWPTPTYYCTIKDCGVPPSVNNASRAYTTTTYNSKVTYTCNTGYSASGTNNILCSSSGTWPTPSYTCTMKNCGTPSTISNGYRTFSYTTYLATVTYYCNTGYEGSGSNTISCQSSGVWSAVGYTCTIISCGNPPSISNGSPSYTTTTYLSTATYSCNMGYLGTADPTITCKANKQWSHTFSCALAKDTVLTKYGYGYLSAAAFGITGYDRNEIVMDLQGLDVLIVIGRNNYNETNMYQIVYLWSNQAWTYFRIAELGSNVASHEETGHVVDFTMKKRFYITWDSNTVKTGRIKNGIRDEFISYYHSSPYDKNYILFSCWATNTATVTFILDCGTPANVRNATYVSGYTTYKATLTWACDAGYIPSGDGTITCQSSAEWTSPTLVCTPKDCGEPALIRNAQASSGFTVYPHSRVYSCLQGYSKTGTDTINCQTTGVWSAATLSCGFTGSAISTSNNNYVKMSNYDIYPSLRAYFVFEVRGCTYAVLVLSSTDSSRADMIQITMDGVNNVVSIAQSGTTLISDSSVLSGVMNCNAYVKFYLHWTTEEITLAHISSTSYDYLISYNETVTYSMNYLLLTSKSGYSSLWNIQEGSDVLLGVRDEYHYHSLSGFGIRANDRSSISFQVKGCNDAFIGISSVDSSTTNMYELVIGSDSNTKTRLRLQAGGSTVKEASSPSILDCNNWRTFYLSWSGSDIIFGKVTDLNTMAYSTVLSYTHSSPYSKNYLLVSGYSSSSHLFKFILDCGPPPHIGHNATITASSTTHKATATYLCIKGWTPAGPNTVTCQDNGAWSPLLYTCTIVDCYDPPEVQYSTIALNLTVYDYKSVYSCIIGYENIGGTDTRTCLETGLWSASTFFCRIKDCGPPVPVENGNITTGLTTYGSNLTQFCDIGYYSEGNETIECLHTAQWRYTDFVCILVDCFEPRFTENCDIDYINTTYLSVVNYTCHIGYLPQEGPDSIYCQANGNWTESTFWCKIIDCGPPDEIEHATHNNGTTTFWKNITYTCDIGYVPHGEENITCQLTGNWTETDYNCPPYDCLEPPDIKDSVKEAPNTTYQHNTTYTCDLGHYESDPGNMSITCTPYGWENFTFWCIPVDCYPPTFELPRAEVSYDTTIFRTINSSESLYTCDIGFTIDPEELADGIVICNYTGLWQEVEFVCIFNYCKNISISYKTPSTYPLQSDGMSGQMYFLNDTMFTVDCCGVISGWEFKPVSTGFIYLMIWRRDASNTPVLVGYNSVLIANTSSIVNVTITDDEKIAVQAFDQIGWYAWEASPIAFEECSPFENEKCPQATLHYDGIEVLPYNYQFDWDNLGNPLSNRSYAIKYYFTRNTPLQFLQEEYNISIPDHWLGDQPIMTFSIVGVDHAEKATYTLEPLGDTPQTIYFYIDSYFGTVKVQQKLPNSNQTDTFVYNVTAVDGCENYAYTILTVNTFNAPPTFKNLPNRIEIDEETGGFKDLYDVTVFDPTDDPVCCTLEKTIPTTENFNLRIAGPKSVVVETTKNAYFSASFVNSYFVRVCCQDRNYSTMAVLQVKVKGDITEEIIPFPDWFYMSLVISFVPIFMLFFSSCTLMLYLTFCF